MKNGTSPQVLVFGLDATDKPQAGRFAATDAETAKRAAVSLKLTVCEVSENVAEVAKEIPMGRLHAKGKAFVPYVKRELNWVRVAQRFPVRIEVENPDPNLFRMGASAVAIIDGPPAR